MALPPADELERLRRALEADLWLHARLPVQPETDPGDAVYFPACDHRRQLRDGHTLEYVCAQCGALRTGKLP